MKELGDNQSVVSHKKQDIKLKIMWIDLGDEFEGFEFGEIWDQFREYKKQSFILKIRFIKKE